jgi:hypothetical protein
MNKIHIIRNEDVNRVLVGVPKGHKHMRICIALQNWFSLIFQEATMANILRVYITVKTNPSIRAQKPQIQTLSTNQRKEGCAIHQLIETPTTSEEIETELRELLEKSELLP